MFAHARATFMFSSFATVEHVVFLEEHCLFSCARYTALTRALRARPITDLQNTPPAPLRILHETGTLPECAGRFESVGVQPFGYWSAYSSARVVEIHPLGL